VESAWFALIGFMLIVYVILDGFDLGAGIVHLLVAKTERERSTILAAIGPFWDGNEVWLIAAGGVLVFAFPRAYAAAFSGFYLPMMMVLWLLILRGVSIEFRSHQENPLWRSFWDATFAISSTVIAIVLGASMGNLVRGVPLDASGYFSAPLFTDFRPGQRPGALDWYTLAIAALVLLVLAGHGALYLSWKTTGAVQARSERLARRVWWWILPVAAATTILTALVQPSLFSRLAARPWSWIFVALTIGAAASVFASLRQRRQLRAFVSSGAFIAGMLGLTAAEMFPIILPSTIDPAYALTAFNAASGRKGLLLGLLWWTPAILLAIAYFVFLFRSFRGKIEAPDTDHGY